MESRNTLETITPQVNWNWLPFSRLGTKKCYQLLQLRARVFITEKGYLYNDLDDKDQKALHILGFDKSDNLVAYARLTRVGSKQLEIGRIAVHSDYRQHGIGTQLMQCLIKKIDKDYPAHEITITVASDQSSRHLDKFYGKFGFERIDDEFRTDHPSYNPSKPHSHQLIRAAIIPKSNTAKSTWINEPPKIVKRIQNLGHNLFFKKPDSNEKDTMIPMVEFKPKI